jgi:spermidine synthase
VNVPALLWFLAKKGDRFTALSLSIFSTGFVGMTMEMILILAFQTLYGYIYHWVGVLIASFMGGLSLGAFLVNRSLERVNQGYKLFLFLEILLTCTILAVVLGLYTPSHISIQGPMGSGLLKALFVLLSIVSGFLVGAEFPLANREASKHDKRVSRIAGRLYALDLAGAWLGTTLVSVLFVPLIGIPQTLLLAGTLKAFCLLYLLLAR